MTTQFALERRHPYRYADRPTFWYDPGTGQMIMPDGKRGVIPTSSSITTILEKIEAYSTARSKKSAVLYLVSEVRDVRNHPAWEWYEVYGGWVRERVLKSTGNAEYSHNGFKVSLYPTGSYFGPEKNLDMLYQAWENLEIELENLFNAEGYRLLGNAPSQTGQELLLISLPKGVQYPRLSDTLLDLIVHNFSQGRIEFFESQREILEDGVYVIDGRFMYASCLSHLPVGPVYRDEVNEFLGVTRKDGKLAPLYPGFYRVTAQAPDDWHHIGLLKAPSKTSADAGNFPNTPGNVFTNWTTADELALAIDSGWPIEIHERIYWPETFKITDPLATLRRKLIDFRAGTEDPLLEDAVRAILLHLVGSFHRFVTYERRVTPRGVMLPESWPEGSMYRLLQSNAKERHWIEAVPLKGANRQRFIHPEWSATVWGRARKRLAEFALRLPYEDIVALRIDSIWCASLPTWIEAEDTGKPGSFRKIDHVPGPWTWPRTGIAMHREARKRNLAKTDVILSDINGEEEE